MLSVTCSANVEGEFCKCATNRTCGGALVRGSELVICKRGNLGVLAHVEGREAVAAALPTAASVAPQGARLEDMGGGKAAEERAPEGT